MYRAGPSDRRGRHIAAQQRHGNELYISSPFTDRSIGITASGTTSVGKVTVMSAATLTQSSVQASGLGPVQVYSDQNAPLVLSGRFSSVTLNGQNRLTLVVRLLRGFAHRQGRGDHRRPGHHPECRLEAAGRGQRSGAAEIIRSIRALQPPFRARRSRPTAISLPPRHRGRAPRPIRERRCPAARPAL